MDITIVGSGAAARTCGAILGATGLEVNHVFELEANGKGPVILGETPGAFAMARQALDARRHLLIASPATLPPDRLALLVGSRAPSQAVMLWNDRRYHPGYRFVNSLTEADTTWRPRYVRLETLTTEPTNPALSQWRTLETVSVLLSLTSEAPIEVSCFDQRNPLVRGPDLLAIRIAFEFIEAFIQVGAGEAIERRETLIAADSRKAYVDELNVNLPLRLVDDGARLRSKGEARRLSWTPPGPDMMARQQCRAFLNACMNSSVAQTEARLWLRSLAVLQAVERSLRSSGAPAPIALQEGEPPRLRLIPSGLANPSVA